MDTIWKYELALEGEQDIEMPFGADILAIDMQNGGPCLWAKVNPDNATEDRKIFTHGTGHPVPDTTGQHLGTYQLHDGMLIFHVFEATAGTVQ